MALQTVMHYQMCQSLTNLQSVAAVVVSSVCVLSMLPILSFVGAVVILTGFLYILFFAVLIFEGFLNALFAGLRGCLN